MPRRFLLVLAVVSACGGETEPIADAAEPLIPEADAAERLRPAGSECVRDDQCAGGTCLGAPGTALEGNPRFTGGYCTRVGCVPESQRGCAAEEWCTTAGDLAFCAPICAASVGLECARLDHVCLGIGEFGGCFHYDRVECNSTTHTGCPEGEVCVRIGFDDDSLGGCETSCDPMAPACGATQSCYYVNRYDGALCLAQGEAQPGETCLCDRCCVAGYACVEGTCRRYCRTDAGGVGCASGVCTPMEDGAPYGGCAF